MITYNPYDHVFYGTSTERAAITLPDPKYPATAKFFEYDTSDTYVTDGEQWYPV
jgi:hypothetical protein